MEPSFGDWRLKTRVRNLQSPASSLYKTPDLILNEVSLSTVNILHNYFTIVHQKHEMCYIRIRYGGVWPYSNIRNKLLSYRDDTA